MKKILALAALMTIAATTSNAADLPQQQPYYRAPGAVSPSYDWSGFYIGVMGGYGFADDATVGNLAITDAGLKGGFAKRLSVSRRKSKFSLSDLSPRAPASP